MNVQELGRAAQGWENVADGYAVAAKIRDLQNRTGREPADLLDQFERDRADQIDWNSWPTFRRAVLVFLRD